MPWLSEAKKDVTSCEKPRVGQIPVDARISEWGNPARATVSSVYDGSEPGELKHLSTPRKRKQQ